MSVGLTQKTNYFLASGASAASGVYTATSGYTKIYGILTYPISGGPPTSSSGVVLSVFDSVSGVANINSGNMIWSFPFGSQSGLQANGLPVSQLVPQLEGPLTHVALSGVVIQTNAGWVVEVVFGG